MSNLCCIHTSPTTPPSNSFHSAPREISAITAEGTRVLFSCCFCNLPPPPVLRLCSGRSARGLCAHPIGVLHTPCLTLTPRHAEQTSISRSLSIRDADSTRSHVGGGAQGRAPVWVPLPGPQHLLDGSVLPTETASHRRHVSAGEPERGDRHGTKGTQLGKGDTQGTERSRCRK